MKNLTIILPLVAVLGIHPQIVTAAPPAPLKLVQTIEVPQVNCQNPNLGRQQLAQAVDTFFMPGMTCHFDRFGLDLKGGRLFVVAFGVAENSGTVQVYALPSGKLLHSITGFVMPHNVFVRSDVNRIYVTDGSASHGFLRIFNGTTYRLVKTVRLLPDADSMAYDPATHNLYVTNGGKLAKLDYTLLSIVNTDSDEHIGDIKINATRLEHLVVSRSNRKIFINITDRREIGIIDTRRRALAAAWPVTSGHLNVALDLDEADHRLFVACRSGRLNVFDTKTGKVIVALPIATGADDVTYDPEHRRIYVSCAEGFVDVYRQRDPDHYTLIDRVPTGPMGKNCILVSSLSRLYVGVPKHGDVESEVLAYRVQ
ncbi:MAG: YncE family protein [Terriglobia bacterium]